MFKAIHKALFWLYLEILWWCGFRDPDGDPLTDDSGKEFITYMLRRTKQRMGWVWWALTLATLTGIGALAWLFTWLWALLYVFLCWLLVHVVEGDVPPERRRR